MTRSLEDQLKIAKQLFIWHRATFRIVGLWPLEPTIWLFHTWFLYDAFHIFMGYVELVLALGNIERVIANITETALGSMIIIKLVLLKYSGTLRETLILAEDGISEKLFLETKEKEIYAVYSAIAMKFVKWMSAFTFMSSVLYHVKPLQAVLKAVLANETIPLLLPYRSHLPFPITDTTTYILVYLYQSPLMYVHAFHTLSASFLITLTLNASGHLAILARRIRSIEPNTSEILEVKLGNFVRRYQEIVRFAKSIDKSFRLILLVELVITTMCLALASYNVLVQAGHVDTTTFITFITVGMCMMLIMIVIGLNYHRVIANHSLYP
ncbi:uncharacterized protein LOC135165187 isoform X2 [Diachasmimorpha longicaudata]|uniref:uncharacterized protein LOC135165187 isoform X2 n=1 Tax=Diachasmimorpha longicaudata TaxID=58733 RepID=UPI0030B8D37B